MFGQPGYPSSFMLHASFASHLSPKTLLSHSSQLSPPPFGPLQCLEQPELQFFATPSPTLGHAHKRRPRCACVAPPRGASSGSFQPLARESSTRWKSARRACFDPRRQAQFGLWIRRPSRRDGSCGRHRFCQAAFLATAVASTSADSASTCAKPRSRRRLRRCLGPCRAQRQ